MVALAPLTTSLVAMKDLRFGDFDGDGRTDIFMTRHGQWQVWYGRTRAWTPTQTSSFPIEKMTFGDFDGVRGTDVVAIAANAISISSGAVGTWQAINRDRLPDMAMVVVGDFDGDGRDDLAYERQARRSVTLSGPTPSRWWDFSPTGRATFRTLRQFPEREIVFPPLKSLLVGRFTSAKSSVVSMYDPGQSGYRELMSVHPSSLKHEYDRALAEHLVIWDGEPAGGWKKLSRQTMR